MRENQHNTKVPFTGQGDTGTSPSENNENNTCIGDLTIKDVDTLCYFEAAIFPEDSAARETLAEEMRHPWNVYRALWVDGKPVGYLHLRFSANNEDAEVMSIGVITHARGHGHGKTLMNDMMQQIERRQTTQIFLEVRRSNTAAINLYKKYGFNVIDKRKNYYRHPVEDALVMRKTCRAPKKNLG